MTDREIDAAVAEKVMGEKVHYWPVSGYFDNRLLQIRQYSTDIKAAFEVLERLDKLGWHYEVGNVDNGDPERFCSLERDGVGRNYTEYCATIPLAICKAALVAIEETSVK